MIFLKMKIRAHKLVVCIFCVFCIVAGSISVGFASGLLNDYFYPPEHTSRMVMVTCRQMVPDNSADWVHVLLAGLLYASSESNDEEMIAVAIKEQDYVTRIYSVP